MSAPILDEASANQSMSTPPRRRRRALTLLTAGTLVLLATGIGVSVALASRPTPTASAPSAATEEPGTATPAAQTSPVQQQPTQDKQTPAPAAGNATTGQPPVLADGKHDAFIRKLDTRGRTVVVDVVQVFKDKDAVKAAIEDGKPRDTAQYLPVYVRNQNPRLRTLALARDLRLDLRGGDCQAPLNHQLTKLAADARSMSGSIHTYYFTLTVRAGAVQQVQEVLAINAC